MIEKSPLSFDLRRSTSGPIDKTKNGQVLFSNDGYPNVIIKILEPEDKPGVSTNWQLVKRRIEHRVHRFSFEVWEQDHTIRLRKPEAQAFIRQILCRPLTDGVHFDFLSPFTMNVMNPSVCADIVSWRENSVPTREMHFILTYSLEPGKRGDNAAFVGRELHHHRWYMTAELLIDDESIKRRLFQELDFWVKNAGVKVWEYMQYHCNTMSNFYSDIHWEVPDRSFNEVFKVIPISDLLLADKETERPVWQERIIRELNKAKEPKARHPPLQDS